jgi:hypothetical protein
MTVKDRMTLACARCGHAQAATLYASVTAAEDPELVGRLLDGTLQRVTCERCGHAREVARDLLHVDRHARRWVQYLAPRPGRDVAPLAAELVRIAARAGAGHEARVTTDVEVFREKVRLFRDGLDDVAIELTKWLVQGTLPATPGTVTLLYAGREEAAGPHALPFRVVFADGTHATAAWPRAIYHGVTTSLVPRLHRLAAIDPRRPFVDATLAEELLSRLAADPRPDAAPRVRAPRPAA